jgi:hypothetical protein
VDMKLFNQEVLRVILLDTRSTATSATSSLGSPVMIVQVLLTAPGKPGHFDRRV